MKFAKLCLLVLAHSGVMSSVARATASEEYCKLNPYASSCSDSDAYCEKNPYSSSCSTSEAYCKLNPYSSSCSQ